MTFPLATIDMVKTQLPSKSAEPDDLIFLEQLIQGVSSQVEAYLDRQITIESNKVEQFDVSLGEWKFDLQAYPVTSVSEVNNDWDRSFESDTVVDSDNYYVDKANGVLWVDKVSLVAGPGVLKVTYSGGMANNQFEFIDSFPEIAQAVVEEVVHRFRNRTNQGYVSLASAGSTVTLVGKSIFLPSVEDVLALYARY